MSEYKDTIKALATKLQKDRNNFEMEDGSENLNYIMDVRLQQDIIDTLVAEKLVSYSDAIDVSSKIATKYLDGIIGLSGLE
jgi:hypothetical protein